MKYKRNKDADITQDSLNYKYNAGTNQLQYITDNVASNVSTTDIDGQLPNNYIYDKSGNMVADNSQSMAVSWSPYGKILQNNKAGGANLTFGYNAMQQRVLKRVVIAGDTTRTYYIRDAQGNTMSVYTRHNDSVSWREQYIFGSSRLGFYRADTLVNKGLTQISKLYEGKRNYELTNHLGNVMAVINDRKADTIIGVNKGYNAVVISATDYYPFGMAIDSRSYTSSLYRYGFNGKENDKETGEQDYGERMYDRFSDRFLSIDPIGRRFPELSPYQYASNSPIQAIDFDGLEARIKPSSQSSTPSMEKIDYTKVEKQINDGARRILIKELFKKIGDAVVDGLVGGAKVGGLTLTFVMLPSNIGQKPYCEMCAINTINAENDKKQLERVKTAEKYVNNKLSTQKPDEPKYILYQLTAKEDGVYVCKSCPPSEGGSIFLKKGETYKYGITGSKSIEDRYKSEPRLEDGRDFLEQFDKTILKKDSESIIKSYEKVLTVGYYYHPENVNRSEKGVAPRLLRPPGQKYDK